MMNPQAVLWALPTSLGETWWIMCAVLAFPAALIVFFRSVMNQPINPSTICRFLHVCCLVAVSAIWVNSGWLPWAVLMFTITSVLWATLPVWQMVWDWVGAWRRRHAHAMQEQRRHGLGD